MQTITKKIDKIAALQPWKHELFDFIQTSDLLPTKNILNSPFTTKEIYQKLDNLKLCGHHLETEYNYQDGTKLSGEHVLKTGNFCKAHLICPVCATRLQSQTMGKYKKVIYKAVKDYKNAYMLTITVKDGESLSERVKHLKDSLKRLRKRKTSEFAKVNAAIIKLEVHKGENSSLWHPHFHCLIFSEEKIDYRIYDQELKKEITKKCNKEKRIPTKKDLFPAVKNFVAGKPVSKLSIDWLKASRGDSCNIDCTPIRRDKYKTKSPEENVFRQSIEVLKYVNKFNAARSTKYHSADDYIEVICSLANKRTRSTTGDFYRLKTLENDYNDNTIKYPDGGYSLGWNKIDQAYTIVDIELKNQVMLDTQKKILAWSNKITGRFRALRSNRIKILKLNNPFCNVDKVIDSLRAKYLEVIRFYKNAMPDLSSSQIDSLLVQ